MECVDSLYRIIYFHSASCAGRQLKISFFVYNCVCVFVLWFSCVLFSFCFAFNGAKNGLNILSINSLSQNISFLCTFYFWVSFISYLMYQLVHFSFLVKNSCFPSFLHCWTFSSHSHTVRKKIISFLQSREFLVSPLRLYVFLCNGVSLWWCRRDLFCFTCSLFCLLVCCWDVLLCLFSLLSNKSHSFSWTWHLELYFLFFNYFYYLLPIDIAGYWFLAGVLYVCVSVSSFVLSSFL